MYNIEPPGGMPAEFVFKVAGSPVFLDSSVRTGSDYGITVNASNVSEAICVVQLEGEDLGCAGRSEPRCGSAGPASVERKRSEVMKKKGYRTTKKSRGGLKKKNWGSKSADSGEMSGERAGGAVVDEPDVVWGTALGDVERRWLGRTGLCSLRRPRRCPRCRAVKSLDFARRLTVKPDGRRGARRRG